MSAFYLQKINLLLRIFYLEILVVLERKGYC